MSTHPTEPDSSAGDEAEDSNPTHLPVEPEFDPALPPVEPEDPVGNPPSV